MADLPPDFPPDETVETLQSGYRYALSLAHNKSDAEDLVQESCLKLLRRYGKIRSRPLLLTTIRRVFIDRWRRQSRALEEVRPLETEMAGVPCEPGAAQDLHSLLGQLRPEEREALYLHHVEGYTAQEIAALTETPRNTVLSHLHRGLRKLRAPDARSADAINETPATFTHHGHARITGPA